MIVLVLLALSISASVDSYAQSHLELEDVLKSTREQAPAIEMALQKILYYESKNRAASGSFDSTLDVDYYNRDGEYYDGSYYKAKVTKPLPYLNTKIYGGYKSSDGKFPDYEGAVETLDQGEVMGGISLSLLRNRSIDPKRLKLRLAEMDLSFGKLKQKDLLMTLQQEATIAYWNWVSAGLKLNVAESLLELAQKRQAGFKKRIAKGDMAAIYAVENGQYILKRKSKVAKLKAEVRNAALYMSLFYRNENGAPLEAQASQLPNLEVMKQVLDHSVKQKESFEEKENISEVLSNNYSLKSLYIQKDQLEKTAFFNETRYQPELDVKYEYAKDMGSGPKNLYSSDHKIYLSLSIPIERRKISGTEAANKAMLRIKEREIQYKKDQLSMKTNQLKTKLLAYEEVTENTLQEVEFCEKLEDSERRKFQSGDSDYFVVNIREQNTADAREKLITTLLDYHVNLAQYRAILMAYDLK